MTIFHAVLYGGTLIINNSYTDKMKTLSIHKNKALSASEADGKWWRSKNMFFSILAEEDFTNKEVVLVHIILITLLTCTAFIETYPVISIPAVIVSAVCVKFLNNVSNKNSNVTD